jgi:GTP-binding protein
MIKPLVAVVGKPNVGKSTFFNKLTGSRISIVLDTPNVTRDRIYCDCDWAGYNFTLIDTGGIELKSRDEMFCLIKKQAEIAIEVCDVILFFTDGKNGLTVDDYDIADLLRKSKKPVVLVVNKVDNYSPGILSEFYGLSMGEPLAVSSEQKIGFGEVLDEVIKHLKKLPDEEEKTDAVKIAVVGKPNAGKSSLVNKILGYERTIVSPVEGTTRDAIDTPFTFNDKKYIIIDTAGMRRKRGIEDASIEQYSVLRALNAVRRADVSLVLFDSSEELSEQDVRIAGYVHEQGKPSVIVLNKWDLIEKDAYTVEKFNKKLSVDLSFMDYFKTVFISALTGKRVDKVMDAVDYVWDKANFRATTGLLNDVLHDAICSVEPPAKKGKRLKVFYITQTGVQPPTFVLFVNDGTLMHFSYKRYLENNLRKAFSLDGTPIKLIIRNREDG